MIPPLTWDGPLTLHAFVVWGLLFWLALVALGLLIGLSKAVVVIWWRQHAGRRQK